MPAIIEPLRSDWKDVQAAVELLTREGKDREALALVRDFHRKLCEVTVLDPACGSGNFLYVALELIKRLEGEVTALMAELGEEQTSLALSGHTVDPHQFLGIEVNPWAAAVAELVLWIGYLQWHYRTHGQAAPSEPVLRDFRNIECRDAVLTWTDRTQRMDDDGRRVTRWDGVTTMRHPATGEEVPDPTARTQVWDYAEPRAAKWPAATFIVGNPPFIGASRMRDALGDGYVEALWKAYPKVPQSADFVMFWWEKAAVAARTWNGKEGVRRFSLITTNSLRQTFNRRVLEPLRRCQASIVAALCDPRPSVGGHALRRGSADRDDGWCRRKPARKVDHRHRRDAGNRRSRGAKSDVADRARTDLLQPADRCRRSVRGATSGKRTALISGREATRSGFHRVAGKGAGSGSRDHGIP